MKGSARRPGRPLRRLGRLLLGRNELRRPTDRIEALIVPRAPGPAPPRQLGVGLGRRRPAMDEPPVAPPLRHILDDATG